MLGYLSTEFAAHILITLRTRSTLHNTVCLYCSTKVQGEIIDTFESLNFMVSRHWLKTSHVIRSPAFDWFIVNSVT